MGRLTALLLAVCVAYAAAVPTGQWNTCARSCSNTMKFSFDEGISYVYDYEVETGIMDSPTSDKTSQVSVKAKATVGVTAPCEFTLSLSDVNLEGSQDSEKFASAVGRKSLRFAFDDGKITNLCAPEDEEEWVLNFKRGVLSSFQNSMRTFEIKETVQEEDVTGECKTEYEPLSTTSDAIKISRKKLSANCNRTPFSTHTTLPTQLQNLPIISADQTCEQTITAGVMTEVECREIISMKDLDGSRGTSTVIESKLTLTSQSSGSLPIDSYIFKEKSMKFEEVDAEEEDESHFIRIESILSELEEKSNPTMGEQVPILFSELIQRLKHLDARQMSHIYKSYKGSRVYKFLLDAAPLVSTGASTILMTELIRDEAVGQKEAELWYTSLAFVQRPDLDMFYPIADLLKEVNHKDALYGAGALVKNYCKYHEACHDAEGIQKVISAIEEKLGSACRTTNDDERDTVLYALKALSYAGQFTKPDVVKSCILDENNPTETRVAALEFFKKLPCSFEKSEILPVYSDSRYDSEIRINAYLALMSCPTENLVSTIKEKLMSESVNQVGTFVWTHLTNLQESASMEKQWIRHLIGENTLINKFNSSALKLSRNMETSIYMEELGLGSTIESNIIYGSDSYLPRSGMFNLSFDLFGESVNLLELGGRMEGFEIFIEKFFGADGYYPDETAEAIVRSLRQGKVEEESLVKRMWGSKKDEPLGSYYLRLFGEDRLYHHFHGIENIFGKTESFDLGVFLANLVSSGTNDFSKSFQLMDTELIYPTVSGFPLTFKTNGSANIGFKVDGDFTFTGLSSMNVDGHVYPSAAFEIDTSIYIDTHFSKYGMKKTWNGQNGVTLDGKLSVENGRVLDLTLEMPEDKKIKVLNLKKVTLLLANGQENALIHQNELKMGPYCMPMIASKLCTEMTSSSIGSDASVYILKTDTHDSYKLRLLKEDNSFSFLFDTPKSTVDRKISFTALKSEDNLKVDLYSPWKSLKGSGTVSSRGDPKIDLEILVDNSRKYQGGAELKKILGGSSIIYEPSLQLYSSGRSVINTSGRFEMDSAEGKLSMSLESSGIIKTSVSLEGINMDGVTSLEGRFLSSPLELSIEGKRDCNRAISELEVGYKFHGQSQQSIKYKTHFGKSISAEKKELEAEVLFVMTQYRAVALHAQSEISFQSNEITSEVSLSLGNGVFHVAHEFEGRVQHSGEGKIYDLRTEAKSNTHNVDVSLTKKTEVAPGHYLTEVSVKSFNTEVLTSKFELGFAEEKFFKIHTSAPRFNVKTEGALNEVSPRNYEVEVQAQVNDVTLVELNGSINDQSLLGEKIDTEISFDSKIYDIAASSQLAVSASNGKVAIEGKGKYGQMEKFLKISGSSTSFEIETDIGAEITLSGEAKLGEEKSIDITGTLNGQTLEMGVSTGSAFIEAQVRFASFYKKMRADLMHNGAMIQMMLTPADKVEGKLTYSFGDEISVGLSVLTPFGRYTRQEVNFELSKPSRGEFSSNMEVVWKNSPAMSLRATGKVENSTNKGIAMIDASVTNNVNILGFESGHVVVRHERYGQVIDSLIHGSVNGQRLIEGQVKSDMSSPSKSLELKLKTPVHEDFLLEVTSNDFKSAQLDVKYGEKTLQLKYDLSVISNEKKIVIEFSSPQLTTASLTATIEKSSNEIIVGVEAKVMDRKYAATTTFSRTGSSYEGDIRVILPAYSSPITASIGLDITNGYNLNVLMTRFWANGGEVKIHNNLNLKSASEIEFLLTCVSPDTHISVDSVFKSDGKRLTAYVKTSVNDHKHAIETVGVKDLENGKLNLRAIVSANDVRVFKTAVEYKQEGITYATRMSIESGEYILKISNVLNIEDKLNWQNKLEVNNMKFMSELRNNNGILQHNMLVDTHFLDARSNIKLDLSSKIVSSTVVYGDKEVFAQICYDWRSLGVEIKSPFEILSDVKLESKIQSSNGVQTVNVFARIPAVFNDEVNFEAKLDSSSLSISLENGNNSIMSLRGQMIGGSVNIEAFTPFSGFENVSSSVSVDRSKRSAEFSIMNDSASAGIRASFNSLSIKVTSPYSKARQSSFLLERSDDSEIKLHYERNDNVIDFSAVPGPRRSFQITLKSEIPGWEFLALTGRLDREEILGYLEGQINERKMTIEGGGKYSINEKSLKFDITTPYSGYERITAEYKFQKRRGIFDINVTSSSDLKLKINYRRNNPLSVDIFLPHDDQPTIVNGRMSKAGGNLEMTTRFSFIQSIKLQYSISMNRGINFSGKLNYNGIEVFSTRFEASGLESVTLDIHLKRTGHESHIHFDRHNNVSKFWFRRDGKEFKLEASRSGNASNGSIDFAVNNSFREEARSISGSLQYDRRSREKTFNVELNTHSFGKITIDAKYEINLRRPTTGKYSATVSGSFGTRTVSGSWDVADKENIRLEGEMGGRTILLVGKITLREGNFEISGTRFENPLRFEWRFNKSNAGSDTLRDYYLKAGSSRRFVMLKLKGKSSGISHGEGEVAFQASRFMAHPLKIQLTRNHDSQNGFTASGTYERGNRRGSFELRKLKRDASTRSFVLDFEATTNVPGMRKIIVKCDYSFNNEAVFNLDIDWGRSKVAVHFDITNITSQVTQQSANFSFPGLGDVKVSFGHDFSARKRKFNIESEIRGRQYYLKAEWTRNRTFTRMNGKIDANTMLFGRILVNGNYDFRNIDNSKAELKYERGPKFFNLNFERTRNAQELKTVINFDSSNSVVPSAKMEVIARFVNGFHLRVLLQRANRSINFSVDVAEKSVTAELTTPYQGFEKVSGSLNYEATRRNKKVTLRLTRGDRKINVDINFERRGNRRGSLSVSAATPYALVRTLKLDANWRGGKGTVTYSRNDQSYSFEGAFDVKVGRTSFDVSFVPQSGQAVKIAFKYNPGVIIEGNTNSPQEIAKLNLEIFGESLTFNLHGHRNAEKVFLELKAESTFEQASHVEFKLDSELNTNKRQGLFEMKVNDFYFKVMNSFERKQNNGYYWKSEFDSTLTNLPGLIVGIGRENDARIVTIGSGDKEITVKFEPKDNFRTGFSGALSLPHRGITDAEFDINYKFTGPNELDIDAHVQLEPGKTINIDIIYNSDGVQARMSSPMGSHHARAKRSISENSFSGEVGFDDYSITLRGDRLSSETKKGFKIEGELFGKQITIDTLLQADGEKYYEGKFMIESNIIGYERFGGLFTYAEENGRLLAQTQVNLPVVAVPHVTLHFEFDKLNKNSLKSQLNIADRMYSLRARYDLSHGFDTEIVINTPIASIAELIFKGKVLKDNHSLSSNIDIKYPSGSFNGNFKLSSADTAATEFIVDLKSNDLPLCSLNFNFESNKTGVFKLDASIASIYISNPVSINLSLDEHVLDINSNFNGRSHNLKLEYLVDERQNFTASVVVSSPIVNGRYMVDIESNIIQFKTGATDRLNTKVSYSGFYNGELKAMLDRTNGIATRLSASLPSGSYLLEGKLSENEGSYIIHLKAKCPTNTHEINVTMDSNTVTTSRKVISLDVVVESSLLPYAVEYKLKGELEARNKMFEQFVKLGEVIHSIKSGYAYSRAGANFIINVETPIFNIRKLSIGSNLKIQKNIEADISFTSFGQDHTFSLRVDSDEKKLNALLKTPLLTGGEVRLDASIKGQSTRDMDVTGSIRFNNQAYSTKLRLNFLSFNDVSSELEVKTPFDGYRKMNFTVTFKYDSLMKIIVRADKPVGVRLEIESGKQNQGYKTNVHIETPVSGYEKITIKAEIPLSQTAAKVLILLPTSEYGLDFEVENQKSSKQISGNVLLNGEKYGAGLRVRYDAPYELSYFCNSPRYNDKFHVRMDSTMYQMLIPIV